MVKISRLIWDDWNVEHIARHDVHPDEVDEVCQGESLARNGKKGRVLLIGPTDVGRLLAVVLDPEKDEVNVYYPVTARPAARRERRLYQEQMQGGDER